MKKLLFAFCLISLPVLAQDPPTVSPQIQQAAGAISDQMKAMSGARDDSASSWKSLEDKFAGFQKQAGVSPDSTKVLVLLRQSELALAREIAPERYEPLLAQLVDDPVIEVSGMAQDLQQQERRIARLKKKPLDLQFTAVDGNPVDLAQYRGKVVALQFWAMSDAKCVRQVPRLVETYQKFHDQGFVILGISQDTDKDALTQFTQQHNMPWVQYFDGLGKQNKISSNYDIQSIPTLWLVDKKGMLVGAVTLTELNAQLPKLLVAP